MASSLFLLILPASVILSQNLVTPILIQYLKSISTPTTVQQNLQTAKFSVDIFLAFEIVIFIVMMVVYPMLSWWAPYKKDGYRSLVAEFKFIKKVVVAAFSVIIVLTILQIINQIVYPFGVSNPS